MAVRNVYTPEEKKMLADFEAQADERVGWLKSVNRRTATEDSMKNMAVAIDYWNPLWRDDDYAANTRWGGIIAIPMYAESLASDACVGPMITPEIGHQNFWYVGEDFEFFKPIRVNDTFKVWCNRPRVSDETDPDGKGPRKLGNLVFDLQYLNQRDELVNTYKRHIGLAVLPEAPPAPSAPKPDYSYSPEELAYIERIAEEEMVRGAAMRYWEDVKVGEELRPVVLGPTTTWDIVAFFAGRQEIAFLPMREIRKRWRTTPDPATGVTHMGMEAHLSDGIALLQGDAKACHFGAMARQEMVRCITNWIGDDGFLRRFKWRHLMRTAIGDTIICRGRVVNKSVENGEHLVHLAVYSENIRGNITEAATATVSLLSREDVH